MFVASLDFALCVCEIRDKLQVVNKELTRDWVNSKVADSEFYSQKKLKRYYQ